MTLVVILAGILERSHVPVLSLLLKHTFELASTGDSCSEEPAKELENLREFSAKEYIHQLVVFRFELPVFNLNTESAVFTKAKFPYFFYPDVPTPPPNGYLLS
ncbi:hypothetical protein [Mucilaginibacter lacusdianchii]|uniref:hypothetical protein n=1 Tax=Mucilaginibacter lacusdianchii TaxID=2684211 RepID=UPI00131C6C60|nr:hypothetical protein [Mucilaginibacter sp. JXJ CY 39]